ncbi:MAG: hypothetical protein KDD22_06035 [Bdellovibrionales bacterium]|nr:hypothetical protein [Bdellovibrionales bacterium]
MKNIIAILILSFTFSVHATEANLTDPRDVVDTDEGVMSPDQEFNIFSLGQDDVLAPLYRFSQTSWRECTDSITGNYIGYNCVSSRQISDILSRFMNNHFLTCVNEGLVKTGYAPANDLHVTHVGIHADPRHSPQSLHSENRAIDVKEFVAYWPNGASKRIDYQDSANRNFFVAFRQCWGRRVNQYNGCPLYSGESVLTGSIGWENANHQHHMHVSVPYCVGGNYGSYYYMR